LKPDRRRGAPPSAWRAAHAAVTGAGHIRSGIPCQDAAATASAPGAVAICVCDGAGSAARSDQGAAEVARAVAAYLAARGPEIAATPVWRGAILKAALAAVEGLVRDLGGEPGDYACTLLGVVVTADKVVTVHVGDGVIAWVNRGTPETLSGPDNGEYANVTVFVTTPGAERRTRLQVHGLPPQVGTIALMTDGAQASLYDKRRGVPSMVVEQLAAWLDEHDESAVSRQLAETIQKHLIPRTHDDCTVAVLRRAGKQPEFVCPECRRWTLVRHRAGRSRFVLVCPACRRTVTAMTLPIGQHPVRWVRHLVRDLGLSPQEAWRFARVPARMLRATGLAHKV
jgi:hypothetical protein